MKRDLLVYTASIWYRDNDTHTYVIALTARKARIAAMKAVRNQASMDAHNDDSPCLYCKDEGQSGRNKNSGDHVTCLMSAQAWSGVQATTFRNVIGSVRFAPYERKDIKNELRCKGYAYGPTF